MLAAQCGFWGLPKAYLAKLTGHLGLPHASQATLVDILEQLLHHLLSPTSAELRSILEKRLGRAALHEKEVLDILQPEEFQD